MSIIVSAIHCYPIKGLGGYALTTSVMTEQGIPHDRRFGLAFAETTDLLNGTAKWRPWEYLVSLKKFAAAAQLFVTLDETDNMVFLTINSSRGCSGRCDVSNKEQRQQLEGFISDFLQIAPLRLIDSQTQPLWDEQAIALTLVNDESVADLAATAKYPMENARFRPNISFTGSAPWQEDSWHGKRLHINNALLHVEGGVPRCAATTVNPLTAQRDCNPPALLTTARGNNELGLLASVTQAGTITVGMELTLESSP